MNSSVKPLIISIYEWKFRYPNWTIDQVFDSPPLYLIGIMATAWFVFSLYLQT